MADLMEREKVLDEIFNQYDIKRTGELSPEALQLIHSDMRVGGISIPQVEESIKYTCIGDCCERSELFDLLQEMDRRYFLVQDFRWEFTMLDTQQNDTITESQARWFVEMVHGKYFSNLKWERFLRQRAVPHSGVGFGEIEVTLCNIPSREEWEADNREEMREKEELAKQRRAVERLVEEEKEKRKRQREEERRLREQEEMKKKLEEERRAREDEAERRQRWKEKEEAARRKRQLEEEEERGRQEAEERLRKEQELKDQKDREERERKQKRKLDKHLLNAEEEQELARLQYLAEQHRHDEEERRKQDLQEAHDFERILKDVHVKEREAEEEEARHRKRKEAATDDAIRREAEEAEQHARLRQRELRNKRLRFNLKVAIRLRDRDRLAAAVSDFKRANLPDDDQDLPKGDKILREFQAREGLRKAIHGRKIQPLEHAIKYVKHNGFEFALQKDLLEANKVLLQLRRLERIRAEILELKQATVAEIRSYQKPPAVVHIVMTGTFLLLGNKEKETKDWKNVQALVGKTGKEGLKRRCLECDPGNIKQDEGKRAKILLSQFELDEVRDVSAGAATFYVWSWTMIEESEARMIAKQAEEEEKKRLQEERRQKKLQEAKEREERGEPPIEDTPTPRPAPAASETAAKAGKPAPKKGEASRGRSLDRAQNRGVQRSQSDKRSKSTGPPASSSGKPPEKSQKVQRKPEATTVVPSNQETKPDDKKQEGAASESKETDQTETKSDTGEVSEKTGDTNVKGKDGKGKK